MKELAPKIREGLQRGDPTAKGIGIDHNTLQRLYRQMKAENYEGSVVFFVCERICDEVMGKTKDFMIMADGMGKPFPANEEVLSFITEKDEDVLFCAMQGALVQSGDKVGKKCLDIIYQLYQSSK